MVHNLFKKNWLKSDLEKYIGPYQSAYLSYAKDESVRDLAASGGVVSAILIHALETGTVDGALVCRGIIKNGRVRAQFSIARDRSEVLSARGSQYVAAPFHKEALPLIWDFKGKLAVVGLPCNISAVDRLSRRNPAFFSKIALKVALVCGHSSQPALVDILTSRLERQANSSLRSFRFRQGHWRGKMRAEFENGTVIERPSFHYLMYQNLYFWSERKCFYCYDHFGYRSDLSVGDVWLMELKKNPVKQSGVIIKTVNGRRFFDAALDSQMLVTHYLDIRELLNGQARVAPFHYNVSARHLAGKVLGLPIPDITHEKVRWNEFLVALIMIFNWKWSQQEKAFNLITLLPRAFLRLYLYFFKGLESLR